MDVEVDIRTGTPLKGFRVVVGFPGIGLVGPIVARHIVESTKMRLVGPISSKEFPAVAAIRKGVALPPVRIYADEEKRVAVIVSEVAFSEQSARALGRRLVEFAKDEGVEGIISIAGVILPGTSGDAVWGAASHPEVVEELAKHGIRPVKKGITTGISATRLTQGRAMGVPVTLLLGTLHAKEDFRAAADIVMKLDEMLGLNIPYKDLLERAEAIERDVAHIIAQTKRDDSPMYG